MMTQQPALRWDLTSIYPDLDSKEFKQDNQKIIDLTNDLKKYLEDHQIDPEIPATKISNQELAEIISGILNRLNQVLILAITLEDYLLSIIDTDSFNDSAKKALSEFEPVKIQLDQLSNVVFKGWLGQLGNRLDDVIQLNPTLKNHSFMLKETIEQSKFLMSSAEEELTGQLSISGVNAWSKLENDIVTQLKWEVENEEGVVERLPLTAIINLRTHPDEIIRRRAYQAEMEAWKTVETPLAACLNGVKGVQSVLDKRRGRQDFVHHSLDLSRIDHETLEVMLAAVKDSFPVIRKYFKAKAKHLGKEALPWWDIYAPLGKLERKFTFPEAQQFILEVFSGFSEDLAKFADRAFKNNWIDVAPREGKSTGAFCANYPAVKESRIMLNFEENIDGVITLAHELGHGYHNQHRFQLPILQQTTPRTLAETASNMCETIVTNAAIQLSTNPQEKLAILGATLVNDGWMIADIYSRYLFETEVFSRRIKAELSAEEINEIMEWAQLETYGDGLDPDYLNKYMWTWKPHYYIPEESFYNYQYIFGMFFANGLYAIYQERGDEFVADYKNLLASTGLGTSAELAARFDIDLHSPAFWEGSLKVVEQRVEQFSAL